MASQKQVTIVSIHQGTVLVEFEDGSRDRFPLSAFPENVKAGDKVLVGLESRITHAVVINGEDVPSTALQQSWNGYTLSCTSTSDSGWVELEEAGEDQLKVIYKTANKTTVLGVITAEWDGSHTFARLSFAADDDAVNIRFVYLGGDTRGPVELFYEHTAFHVISDRDVVTSVDIRER